MRSKVAAAGMAGASGIGAVICDGTAEGTLLAAAGGDETGTRFSPHRERTPSFKLWLRYAKPSHGKLLVDDGAARVLRERGSSLLPVGITEVEGEFDAGDAVDVDERRQDGRQGDRQLLRRRAAQDQGPADREGPGAVAARL